MVDSVTLADPARDPLDLLNRILRCRCFEDLRGGLLDPTSHTLRCSSAALVHMASVSAAGDAAVSTVMKRSLYVGRLTQAIKNYANGDFRLDPIFRLQANRVHRFSMRRTRADRGAPFQQFLRCHDIHETIGVTLPIHTAFSTDVFALSYQRGCDGGGFGDADFGLVQGLVPALQAMLRQIRAAQSLTQEGPSQW
jgi:hypothetical protein